MKKNKRGGTLPEGGGVRYERHRMIGAGKPEQQGTPARLSDRQWAMQECGKSLQRSTSEQEGLTQGDRRPGNTVPPGPPLGVVFRFFPKPAW